MRKGYIKVIAAIATLLLALFGFAACTKAPAVGGDGDGGDDDPDYGDGSKLACIVASDIVATETINQNNGIYVLRLEWAAAEKASSYKVKCNGKQLDDVTSTAVSVSKNVMTMPSDGKFSFEIVSAGPGYVDSDPTRYSYSAEGVQLNSLEITSFENGILKWRAVPGVKNYTVAYGERGGATTETVINGTQLNVNDNDLLTGKALSVAISVPGDGVYTKTSDPVHLNVNAAHTKLTMSPVTEFTLTDGVLSWAAVGGAKGYRVVDIEYNSRVITATEYDVSDKIPVYGVFPVSSSTLVADAELERVDIPYLAEGDGTANDPYVITTPFELRMIDYYEALYAEDLKTNASLAPLNYKLAKDLDYNSVSVPEGVSNIYPMSKPFYGKLNGNNKTLRNIRVRHASGYWALFDFVAPGAEVKKLNIEDADVENELANLTNPTYPVGAKIAAIAYKNYGTISSITLTGAKFTATGGEVSGIVSHNYAGGVVEDCSVAGTFKQKATGQKSQACYEMAGVVLENSGTVQNNILTDLTIEGSAATGNDGGSYNCVRSAGGIVSVNRKGGVVKNNSYTKLTMKTILTDTIAFEEGGIVAYNAPGATVTKGTGTLGTFTFNGTPKSNNLGSVTWSGDKQVGEWVGKLVGKNEGTATE